MIDQTVSEAPATGSCSWAAVVATYNRADILVSCVRRICGQTVLPRQLIIVDASPNWEVSKSQVFEAIPCEIRQCMEFVYCEARAASITIQRNQGLEEAKADIVFLIDDDSLMHATCAAEILRIYNHDVGQTVVGVQAALSKQHPEHAQVDLDSRKTAGTRGVFARFLSQLLPSTGVRWIRTNLLLMNRESRFLPYDGDYPDHPVPAAVMELDVEPVRLMHGCRMTYRRQVIADVGFDDFLLSYCPGEDADASYRASRKGALLTAQRALIYHHESGAGRIKRRQATALTVLNKAVMTRRHSSDLLRDRRRCYRLAFRFLVAETLKDALALRWSFPQTRGVLAALRHVRTALRIPLPELRQWYADMQRSILSWR
ncbi:MAG: glycosyltransferase [Gammaproteobacteria bacterium]|nr:glycosyltransferase [Gammaproteobacteria bacterium]